MRNNTLALRIIIVTMLAGVPAPRQAQEVPPIAVTVNTVEYTFGQQATFTLEASADAGIAALYLYLQKPGEERVEVVPVPFEAGNPVQATFQRDLRLSPLPPFGQVSWWWEVRDQAGHVLTTPPSSFQYADNRFAWHTASNERVRVHSTVDDPVYLRAALDIAAANLEAIEEALQSPPLEQVDVYLYPSQADLRAALEMGGREWVGGQARPELGVVLVAVPHDDESTARMERDIPHEITHLVIYRLAGPRGYPFVPAWLNEGLATVNQAWPDPDLDVLLEQALTAGQLIPLTDLCAPFPSDPQVARLSYAESASLVRTVRDRYGSSGIRALLAAYADGADCEGGIIQALGRTPQQLETAWRADLLGLTGWTTWLSDHWPWLALWGLSLLLAIPMVGVRRPRHRAPAPELHP